MRGAAVAAMKVRGSAEAKLHEDDSSGQRVWPPRGMRGVERLTASAASRGATRATAGSAEGACQRGWTAPTDPVTACGSTWCRVVSPGLSVGAALTRSATSATGFRSRNRLLACLQATRSARGVPRFEAPAVTVPASWECSSASLRETARKFGLARQRVPAMTWRRFGRCARAFQRAAFSSSQDRSRSMTASCAVMIRSRRAMIAGMSPPSLAALSIFCSRLASSSARIVPAEDL